MGHLSRRLTSGCLLGVLAVSGCSSGTATMDDRSPKPATSSTPVPHSEPSSPSPSADADRVVTLAFAGDIHFEGVLRDRLRAHETALRPVTAALAAADISVANLETSVGHGGAPEPGKRFTFSAGPAAFTALAAAGIDVVTMANNHVLDFGRARLPSTLKAARAAAQSTPPLAVVGVGRSIDEAFAPAVLDVDGVLVATIGATAADHDPTADPTGHWAATTDQIGTADAVDPRRLIREVRRADVTADIVVVYVHWGIQGERCPSTAQRDLATDLVDAGADVIVGSHAHQLQGDGRLGGAYVAYGLGNYAWYSPGTEATATTGVLTVRVKAPSMRSERARVASANWQPSIIGVDGLPRPGDQAMRARFKTERQSLRRCAGLAP